MIKRRFEKDLFENPWKSIKKFGEIYVSKHRPRKLEKGKFNKKFNYRLIKFEYFVHLTQKCNRTVLNFSLYEAICGNLSCSNVETL